MLLAATGGPLTVSGICAEVDLVPNLVSNHLQCLSDCRLLEVEQDIENVLGREVVEETGEP